MIMSNGISLKEMSFGSLCHLIRPIIFKIMNQHQVQHWNVRDWEHEGVICLFRLIQDNPSCLNYSSLFFLSFQMKFSSYLKGYINSKKE